MRRLPGCGVSGVGRSSEPEHPSLGLAPGARYPQAVGAGAVGLGTHHQLHSARSRVPALSAAAAARGRPEGCAFCLDLGRPGFSALPRPASCLWGLPPGPATHWLWVRGLWAW